MASLKEQAVSMVQNIPDEKMSYVVDMLKWITGTLDSKALYFKQMHVITPDNSSEANEAWKRFKKYKGIIPYDIDTKMDKQ